MSLRLFAALAIPDLVVEQVEAIQRGVGGAAWRPPENLHITLRFFGDVDEPDARELDGMLAEIRAAPFEVRLSGAGWFGGERPRALWAGVADNPSLRGLAAQCERAARRAGLPPERRKYAPHLTLAYCHGMSADVAAAFVQRHGLFASAPFLADRFSLYSSWTGKGPSQYVPEAEYPLVP